MMVLFSKTLSNFLPSIVFPHLIPDTVGG
jgi:hypothetical protein